MPIVSVVIPAYNAADYIEQTLDSVCSQTLEDIEVIVVDDGSTDETRSVVSSFVERDQRVTLVEQANQFAGVARNNGMDRALGEYLYFLDADDCIEPDALESMFSAITETGADIAIARSEGFDNQSGDKWLIGGALENVPCGCLVPQADYASHLFSSFIGWPWDKLFRKSFIDKTGLRFQALRTTNDALFVFGALAMASGVVGVDSVLFHHRSNNKKSLEGTRSKSWGNAITAMESIHELLLSSEETKACLPSFNNWVLNYSCWTINSLPDKEADGYLNEVSRLIVGLPESGYAGVAEQELRRLANANRANAVRSSIALRQELQKCCEENSGLASAVERLSNEVARLQQENKQLRNNLDAANAAVDECRKNIQAIYDSHSYRIGNALLKPLSMVKHGLANK